MYWIWPKLTYENKIVSYICFFISVSFFWTVRGGSIKKQSTNQKVLREFVFSSHTYQTTFFQVFVIFFFPQFIEKEIHLQTVKLLNRDNIANSQYCLQTWVFDSTLILLWSFDQLPGPGPAREPSKACIKVKTLSR